MSKSVFIQENTNLSNAVTTPFFVNKFLGFTSVQICCWIRLVKIITQTCTWHYEAPQAYQTYFMPMFAIPEKMIVFLRPAKLNLFTVGVDLNICSCRRHKRTKERWRPWWRHVRRAQPPTECRSYATPLYTVAVLIRPPDHEQCSSTWFQLTSWGLGNIPY